MRVCVCVSVFNTHSCPVLGARSGTATWPVVWTPVNAGIVTTAIFSWTRTSLSWLRLRLRLREPMAARRGAPLALMCTYEAKKNELNVFANARGGAAKTAHCRFISWADISCFSLTPIRDSRMPCMQRAGKEACQSLSTGTRRRQLLPFLPRLAGTKPPRTAPPHACEHEAKRRMN